MSFESGLPAPPPRAAAGWYPDPHDVGGKRFWDGSAWTEHRLGPDGLSSTPTSRTLVLPGSEAAVTAAPVRAVGPAYSRQPVPVHSAAPPAQVYYAGPPATRPSGAHVAIAWIAAVLSFLYFLPWAIAATRGRPNTGGVFVVNLLVGWTVVGWVVALVMSCA